MSELQILRDELDIDQSTGNIFEVPGIGIAFFFGNSTAHVNDIARGGRDISFSAQDIANNRFNSGRKIRCRGDDACAGKGHVLPGPRLVFLIARKPLDLGSERAGPPGRTSGNAENDGCPPPAGDGHPSVTERQTTGGSTLGAPGAGSPCAAICGAVAEAKSKAGAA